MSIRLNLCFDGVVMDDICAFGENEAEEILRSHSTNFSDQNEEIKRDWLALGKRNDPIVTIEREVHHEQ